MILQFLTAVSVPSLFQLLFSWTLDAVNPHGYFLIILFFYIVYISNHDISFLGCFISNILNFKYPYVIMFSPTNKYRLIRSINLGLYFSILLYKFRETKSLAKSQNLSNNVVMRFIYR